MGVVKLAFLLVVYTVIGALMLMCIPGLPPDIVLESYEIKPSSQLEGKLAPNAKLDRAELVFDGDFTGPESVAIRNDEVYTGVNGGHILRVKNGKTEKIVQTGKPCAGYWEYEICGRPLGLRFEPSGKLLVADATQGLLRVDVDKKTVETILPRYSKIVGSNLPLNFADDVDISTKDGMIYFSDAGKVGTYGDVLADMIGEASGRLLRYDPKTKKTEVMISGVRFANGVQLSRKEDFVALSESGMARVLKYYLSGAKAGKTEILIDGLPGYPDNIRSNGKGGFYISLFSSRVPQATVLDQLAPFPLARKVMLRFQRVTIIALEFLNTYAPHEYVGRAIAYAKQFGPLGDITSFPKNVIIVEVDENGSILGSLQNKEGKISYISEVGIGEKYTYFASPFTAQLWRIKTEYL